MIEKTIKEIAEKSALATIKNPKVISEVADLVQERLNCHVKGAWMPIYKAADHFKMTRQTIHNWVNSGKIKQDSRGWVFVNYGEN